MPIIQTRLTLNTMHKGDTLVIWADDPSFSVDFPQFCFLADLKLLSRSEDAGFQVYLVELTR